MKKIILLSLILSMCFCTACGNTSKIDARMEKVAEQMISAVDQYLDFDLEADEAEEKITNLYTRLAEPSDDASKEEKDLYLYATSLDSRMRFVSYQLVKKDSAGLAEAEESLINARNYVARIVGIKER